MPSPRDEPRQHLAGIDHMPLPAPRAAWAEERESERARIVAAMRVALEDGEYESASGVRVAALAGVSRGTFRRHFDGTEACFIAVFDEVFADLLPVALDPFQTDGPWPDRLAAALRGLLEALEDDRFAARVCLVEPLQVGQAATRVRTAAMDRLSVIFRPDPDAAATSISRFSSRTMAGGFAHAVGAQMATEPESDLRRLLPHVLQPALSMHLSAHDAHRAAERLLAAA